MVIREIPRGFTLASLCLAAAIAVSGCASSKPEGGTGPDLGVLGSILGVFDGGGARDEPSPADGRPYPNLASVPRPPAHASPAANRAELTRLAAERDAAYAEDAMLRAGLEPASAVAPARSATSVVMGDIDLSGSAFDRTDESTVAAAGRLAMQHQGRIRLVDRPSSNTRSPAAASPQAINRFIQAAAQLGLAADRVVVEAGGARALVIVEY